MRAGVRTSATFVVWIGLTAAAGAQSPSAQQLRDWVKQLDAEDYPAREEATRLLTEAGEAGVDALAEGVNNSSPEVAWRASESLQEIAIAGNEATLNRVVAALDKLSKNGKPGLSHVAQELRTKQVKLRHDRAAAKIRSLGGRLVGGGPVGMDGGMMMAVEVMPAIAMDFGGDIILEAPEPVPLEELPPDRPVALKALDAALARLADLLPVKIGEPELPKFEEAAKPVEPEPAKVALPDPPPRRRPRSRPSRKLSPSRRRRQPKSPFPRKIPTPPPAEAPLAEPEVITEVLPAEDVAIADAIVVDAFIAGPVFGGGFFIEEDAFPDTEGGLSRSLTLDSSWQGGDDGLAALRDLPSLASLSIVDAKITDAALAHIAALPNLQDLSIVNTKLSVDSLLKFRKQRPNTRIFARGSAMLGVHADTSGSCVLTGIYQGSGAAEAGLQAGDQITTIDGHKIGDFGDLTIAVYAHAPDEKLKVEFLRGGETKTADVQLKPRADLEAPRARRGCRLLLG